MYGLQIWSYMSNALSALCSKFWVVQFMVYVTMTSECRDICLLISCFQMYFHRKYSWNISVYHIYAVTHILGVPFWSIHCLIKTYTIRYRYIGQEYINTNTSSGTTNSSRRIKRQTAKRETHISKLTFSSWTKHFQQFDLVLITRFCTPNGVSTAMSNLCWLVELTPRPEKVNGHYLV